MAGGRLIGQEFLWLWPPGKAYNAYQTRLDKRRRNPDQRALPIDEVEPTINHMASVPGAMLGPDDIDGAVRVPPEELTSFQRFFVMCIKPQQTLFPRRPLSDLWTQRVSAIIDENQMAARQGGKWTLHNSVQRLLLLRSKRERPDEDGCLLRRSTRHRTAVSMVAAQPQPPPAAPAAGRRECDAEQKVHAKIAHRRVVNRSVRKAVQAACWADLPEELLTRILCVRLGDALASPHLVADARDCILTLRRVSMGTLNLVDRFVGAQVASLFDATRECLRDGRSNSSSMPVVAARARALGLGMTDVLRLGHHRIALRPDDTRTVPDWRWYLELRREAQARHGHATLVHKPTHATSALYDALMQRHRFLEPHVWGCRFRERAGASSSGFDHAIAGFDHAIAGFDHAIADELDIRPHMHETAGVGG